MFYVYGYYEKGVVDPFYIGKGQDNRAYEHLEFAKRGCTTPFYKKLSALSYKADVVILEDNLTENEALSLEIQYIAYFGRQDLGTGCLLNLTDGGEGPTGYRHTAATKALLSRQRIGKSHHSTEWKEELSKRMKGNTFALGLAAPNRRPITAFWGSMVYKEYDHIHQVKEDGYSVMAVWKVLDGQRPSAYGLQWQYQKSKE